GVTALDICKELGHKIRTVNGYIQSAINTGRLNPTHHRKPPASVAAPSILSEGSMSQVPPASPAPEVPVASAPLPSPDPIPAPAPIPIQVAPPPAPRPYVAPRVTQAPPAAPQYYSDGFQGGRVTTGYNGGWNNPQAIVRYQVERKVPFDGIVGNHTAPFTEADLCQMYGEGLYKVLRYEPGRPVPTEFEVKVGPNFGAPKYPRQGVLSGEGRQGYRSPWARGGENRWDRSGDDEGEPRRPASFAPADSLARYAQHTVHADASAAVVSEAIRALSGANERAIQQAEKAREGGPDNFLTGFMDRQAQVQSQRFDEDRRRDEQRRREEDERWDRRQKERDEEHKRELERIRIEGDAKAKAAAEERRMLMDLEDKKISLLREEHKSRMELMQHELQLSREQAKVSEERLSRQMTELQAKTDKEIEEAQASLKEDGERERSHQDREFELRKQSLETEQRLQEKILEVRQEQLQQQGGNEVFNTINTLIKEFSKGLEKVVELKKHQSASPEAQVAMVAAGTQSTEGNVRPVEEKPEESAAMGRGAAPAPQAQGGGNVNMEKLIQDMMEQPFFQEVMKEWALHVEEEADPTTFANMYLEWMRDPQNHESRQACSMFANVMKVRSWAKMMKILEPKLPADIVAVFKKPYATDFYDGFKEMVVKQVMAYWQGFLEEQERIEQERKGRGGNGHVAVAPAPAPQPAQGPKLVAEEPEEPPPGPPLPTRADLRSKSAV
ncbi:MAG TPA: hypothetical protein VEN81_01875, partial [Planctomycetota bacterium]|nr:hypothetical protein [Planctomycetota bacterium]